MVQQCSPRKWHGVPGRISWPSITPTTQPSQQAVHSPHWRPRAAAMGITAPWHLLYFRPLPQGHGSLRPTDMVRGNVKTLERPVYLRGGRLRRDLPLLPERHLRTRREDAGVALRAGLWRELVRGGAH